MLVLPTSSASPGLEQPGDGGVGFLCLGAYHSSGPASVEHSPGTSRPPGLVLGHMGKGCTQGPIFGLETSIMARHSSSTIAGQGATQPLLHVAGLAFFIFTQNRGLGASPSWTHPKEASNTPCHPRGWDSEALSRDPLEMHFAPLRDGERQRMEK